MNPTPRRRSGWKLWAGVCAAFGLPLLGLWLWISVAADRRWEEMLADGRRLVEEAKRRDGTREVLRGEPIPGRAWDDYNAADALLKGGGVLSELELYMTQKPGADRAKVLALLQKYAPAVELFRKGGRHPDGQYPWDWSRFPDQMMVPMVTTTRLQSLALAQAHVEAESGHAGLGAEIALDVVRFWQDSSFNVVPIGTAAVIDAARRALDLIRWELLKGILKDADLSELERQLEGLDRTMPSFADALKNNQAFLIRRLDEGGPFNSAAYLGGPRWRYGFSSKLQVTAWYAFHARDNEGLSRCDTQPWAEEVILWDHFDSDRGVAMPASAPPTATIFKSFSSNLRQIRARIRLLRALMYRRVSGEWFDLGDPFGDRLKHEETPAALKVWSLGSDAVDAKGIGTWEYLEGRNIVLEVPK